MRMDIVLRTQPHERNPGKALRLQVNHSANEKIISSVEERSVSMPYQIQKGNIATLKVDVLINPTDRNLSLRRLPRASCELHEICRYLAPIRTGSMEITPSFGFPAQNILHFASPDRIDSPLELRAYYDTLLSEASKISCNSVAVPLFPVQGKTQLSAPKVYEVAIDAIQRFVKNNDCFVYLVVDDEKQVPLDEGLELRLKAFINARIHRRHASLADQLFDSVDEGQDSLSNENRLENHSFLKRPRPSAYLDLGEAEPSLPSQVEADWVPESLAEADEFEIDYSAHPGFAAEPEEESGEAEEEIDAPASIAHQKANTWHRDVTYPSSRPSKPTAPQKPVCYSDISPSSFAALDPKKDFVPEESFSKAVLRLIEAKGMTDPQCYSQANLSRAVFNKLKQSALNPNAPEYQPSKATALALTIGLRLTKEEADELLKKAGFAFSNSNRSDLIVEYFLMQKEYDIFELNEVLFRFGQEPLGSF